MSAVSTASIALRGLLNAYLRETGGHNPGGELVLSLPASGRVVTGRLTYWSATGHHEYGDGFALDGVPVADAELSTAILAELDDSRDRRRQRRLAAAIADSTARISRYLGRPRPVRPADARSLTRYAEQSIHIGHPMHPTPKSAEGFTDADLAAYAPELGAAFPLDYVAVERGLVDERRVAPGEWIPAGIAAPDGYALLPVHPWQTRHLRARPEVRGLIDSGRLIPLGPLGDPVYPTSSVRTVCDPAFGTAWKLPLRVRITNFYRTNPLEHAHRAADASRLLAALRDDWTYDGFDVLVETGYRTVRDPALAEDLTTIFRENPFTDGRYAPQVLAALLEERPGAEPDLIGYLRECGPLSKSTVEEWLRRYLAISLVPALDLWTTSGVSLEAHVQNSLLHLEDGWPTRVWVRDLEGAGVGRDRLTRPDLVDADSPVLYDDAEAWLRLKYYLVTNHLGHLLHVLGRHGPVSEPALWAVVSDVLSQLPGADASDLRRSPTLPAKANLTSRLTGRGERPLYVRVPNPMIEAPR